MVARDGVCLMPVGFPARLPAGRIGHIAVRSGDMVRASKKNTLTLMQLMTEEAGRGVQIIANPITSVFKVA